MPDRPRIRYNLGLVLQHLGRLDEAERQLLLALTGRPDRAWTRSTRWPTTICRRRKLTQAHAIADRMIEAHPAAPVGLDLKKHLEQFPE